jgi:hypothetical protein
VSQNRGPPIGNNIFECSVYSSTILSSFSNSSISARNLFVASSNSSDKRCKGMSEQDFPSIFDVSFMVSPHRWIHAKPEQ